MSEMRLQKILAAAGLASRRRAEDLIRAGRVAVDGRAADSLGLKADPQKAVVTVDGLPIKPLEDLRYYLFHKPAGFLTTMDDPQGRPTIRPFLANLPVRAFPVGRLDYDVSGVLVVTNDGELAARLMHPSYLIPKIYWAWVEGRPDRRALELLTSGRLVIGGKPAAPAQARLLDGRQDASRLELVLTEGRHRQVKRMCAGAGHPVVKLERVAYCGLRLPPQLPPGELVELTAAERNHLLRAAGRPADDEPAASAGPRGHVGAKGHAAPEGQAKPNDEAEPIGRARAARLPGRAARGGGRPTGRR
jgi:pseudouridine synthase